jgi:hypothetical protein
MAETVNIARCPEHGLHGERPACFVCGGEVEQVPMVPASEVARYRAALERIAKGTYRLQEAPLLAREALDG